MTGKTIAQLVRIPLPTCALDLDEVGGTLPPPFPETGGIVCSRYLTRDNLDSVLASIREKDEFDRLKDDPAIDLPSDDARYLTHEELLDRVRTTLDGQHERNADDEEDERGREESTSTYDGRRSSSSRSVGFEITIDHGVMLNANHIQRYRSPSHDRESRSTPIRTTEDELATTEVVTPKATEAVTLTRKSFREESPTLGSAVTSRYIPYGRITTNGHSAKSGSPVRPQR